MFSFKKIFFTFVFLIFLGVLTTILINLYILKTSEDLIFENPLTTQDFENIENFSEKETPSVQAVLVLGAKVYQNGEVSDILEDRLKTALEIYYSGKAEKFLLSGDNGQEEYDEVNSMKDYLLAQGVPKKDIFLDHAGFDTYDSLYRAQKIFQVESLIISTQEFHLPRAVYIGKSLGIETYGVKADLQPYLGAKINQSREVLARIKAFANVTFNSKPKFLGDPIPITGNSSLSWD